MKNHNAFSYCVIAASLCFLGCKKNDNEPDTKPLTPAETVTMITESIENKPELTTFKEAFKKVNLTEAETAEGITIFAPTNEAVAEFPSNGIGSAGKGARISGDTSILTPTILRDHIISGRLTVGDLTNGKTFSSISGKQYKIIRLGDSIRINGVRLQVTQTSSSGIVYMIDKILTHTSVSDTINNPVSACKVSKIFSGPDGNQVYQYDNQDRVIKVIDYHNSKIDEEYIYTYGANQLTVKIYEEGILYATRNYQLVNGRVASLTTSETDTLEAMSTDSLGHTTIRKVVETRLEESEYQHNAEGFLTRSITKSTITEAGRAPRVTRDTISFTYQNGNVIKKTWASPGYNATTTYEYYTDRLNTLPVNGDFFLTKPDRNAVKKETNVSTSGGHTSTNVTAYEYVYNKGLITNAVIRENAGTPQETFYTVNFEYQCK